MRSHTTQNTYDLLSRLAAVEDPLNRITGYGYDDLDRLVQGTDAQNGRSSIGYYKDGNRNTLTDQNTQQTGFAFDLAGRLTTITSAAGNTKAYQYNTRELVSQITNGRQQAANITYDDAGRITSIADPAGTISYTYDNAGNILTVSIQTGPSPASTTLWGESPRKESKKNRPRCLVKRYRKCTDEIWS